MGLIAFAATSALGGGVPIASAIGAAVGAREPLVKAGERLFKKLLQKGLGTELDRYYRIQAAEILLVYCAFFDAVADIGSGIWETAIDDEILGQAVALGPPEGQPDEIVVPSLGLTLPQLRASSILRNSELRGFYQELTNLLLAHPQVLKIANSNAAVKVHSLSLVRESLPEKALMLFEAYDLELAATSAKFKIYQTSSFRKATFQEFVDVSKA